MGTWIAAEHRMSRGGCGSQEIVGCNKSPLRIFGKLLWVLAVAGFLGVGTAYCLEGNWVPKLTGRVNDSAHVLSASDGERLSDMLRNYEQETHHQIAVLTIATLGDEPIETFSLRTFNAWGLGLKGLDNGILVTLAMKERRVRIELGKGMQRFISDADAKLIIDKQMTPAFSKGQFSTGLERGLDRIMYEGRRFVVPIGP
jgi:uncharacterized protein